MPLSAVHHGFSENSQVATNRHRVCQTVQDESGTPVGVDQGRVHHGIQLGSLKDFRRITG